MINEDWADCGAHTSFLKEVGKKTASCCYFLSEKEVAKEIFPQSQHTALLVPAHSGIDGCAYNLDQRIPKSMAACPVSLPKRKGNKTLGFVVTFFPGRK